MKAPKVISRPAAAHYQAPNERIIEFNHKNGGGLISIRALANGSLVVDVYGQDSTVQVNVGEPRAGGERIEYTNPQGNLVRIVGTEVTVTTSLRPYLSRQLRGQVVAAARKAGMAGFRGETGFGRPDGDGYITGLTRTYSYRIPALTKENAS